MNDSVESEDVCLDVISFIDESVGKMIKVTKPSSDYFEGVLEKCKMIRTKDCYDVIIDTYLLFVKRISMWFVDGWVPAKDGKAISGNEDISRIIPYNPLVDILTRIDEQRIDKEE